MLGLKGEHSMFTSKTVLIGIIGVLAVTLIAAGMLVAFSPARISFAQAPTPTAPPATGAPANGGLNSYTVSFLNAFASRLGVTVDKVKEAYAGAIGDSLDQAVKDGKLTQAQADQLKTNLTNRLNDGMLPEFFGFFGFRRFGDFDRFGFGRGGFFGGKAEFGLSSFASALNMTQADLATELQSGKSIADIAKEKNVDLAQVKTSVLEDMKTKLDQSVQNGRLTQAQADEIYNQLSANFDTLVNKTWPMRPFWRMK